MDEATIIRQYKDRIRIFLILYFFSNKYNDTNSPNRKRIFTSEVRIQKIDFLIRNPDFLAYELLSFAKTGKFDQKEIQEIVLEIFEKNEPDIRRLEMEKFFYGAYEDIDDVISFLKSIGFIDFSSKRSINLKVIEKNYYITDLALQKINHNLRENSALQWYINRCGLIKKYFGDLSGSELKVLQYQIPEYKETSYKSYIQSISDKVKDEYFQLFGEKLP